MTPFFSIVMASHLGHYANAATQRDEKFERAVDSVLAQTFMGWELLIVSDGCKRTIDLYNDRYAGSDRIHCIPLDKQPLWSTAVRNWGIRNAQGEFIVYLDTDDLWGPDHLQVIRKGLLDAEVKSWAFFNDHVWEPRREEFIERVCDPAQAFHHGTSNFVHARSMNVRWPDDASYKHDMSFARELKNRGKGTRIPTPAYYVCHDVYQGQVKYDV